MQADNPAEWHIFGLRIRASRWSVVLYFVILLGEIARLATPFFHNPINALWSDPGRWWEYASTGTDTPPLALIDPLLYQAWLSFVAKLTLDIPALTAAYAGLISAITPWLWYRFFREFLDSRELALSGWAVLAWLPSWIGIFSYFMSETLLLPLLGAAMWLTWRSANRRDRGSFILAVGFWLLAAMTRGVVVPLAVAVLPFAWWRQQHRFSSALLAVLLAAVVMGWLGYRSEVKTGIVAPLGQAALNRIYAISGNRQIKVTYFSNRGVGYYYVFVSPSMGTAPLAPLSDATSGRRGRVHVRIDLDDQAQSWAKEEQRIAALAPPAWPLIGENVIYLMFGTSWPDNNPAHLFERLTTMSRFAWAPLFVAALLMLAWAGRRRPDALPLLFALVFWFSVQGLALISVNEGRYRKPIEGVVIAALLLAADRRAGRGSFARGDRPGTDVEGHSSV